MKRGILLLSLLILLSYVVLADNFIQGHIMSVGDNITVGGRNIKFFSADQGSDVFKIDGLPVRVHYNENISFHGIWINLFENDTTIAVVDITAYDVCGDNTCSTDEFCCTDCGCGNNTGLTCVSNMCVPAPKPNLTSTTPNSTKVVSNTTSPAPTNNLSQNTTKFNFPNISINLDFLKDRTTQYMIGIIVLIIILVFVKFELSRRRTAKEAIKHIATIKQIDIPKKDAVPETSLLDTAKTTVEKPEEKKEDKK